MSATNAGFGLDCVEVVEAVRVNCKNFQGSWSGRMRVKLNKVKDVIRALAQKAESAGDPSLLKARVRELSNELLAANWDLDKKKIEFEELKIKNENLRKEIAGMKIELDKMENEKEDLWRVFKELKAELFSLKNKGRANIEGSGKRADTEGRALKLADKLTSSGNTSPMAGPSRSLITGTPRDTSPEIKNLLTNKFNKRERKLKKRINLMRQFLPRWNGNRYHSVFPSPLCLEWLPTFSWSHLVTRVPL